MKISAQRSLRSLSRRPAASESDEQANVQLRFQIRQAPGLLGPGKESQKARALKAVDRRASPARQIVYMEGGPLAGTIARSAFGVRRSAFAGVHCLFRRNPSK
jgi:hypothetical protein